MLVVKQSVHYAIANAPYKLRALQILNDFEFHARGWSRYSAPNAGGFGEISSH